MTYLRDKIGTASKVKYALWRLSGNAYEATLQLASGPQFTLRPKPYNDTSTAHEIFVEEIYEPPAGFAPQGPVNLIVDMGANVGYSCIYWLSKYPGAEVIAYEPHPAHVEQINKHLALNTGKDCVTVIQKAVGAANDSLYLTDDEFNSAVSDQPGEKTIQVDVVDYFGEIGYRKIDILKIDIEGSEYALLDDKRFPSLDVGLCVLEWHNTKEVPDGRAYCTAKLESLGYRVAIGKVDGPNNGLLWAARRETTVSQQGA